MPITFSFPGQLDQTTWWQPAQSAVVKLREMEPSHRANTHALIRRAGAGVARTYGETLRDRRDHEAYEAFKAEVARRGVDEWLCSRPLMQALACEDEGEEPEPSSPLAFRPLFVLPDPHSVDRAAQAFLILDAGAWRLRIMAYYNGNVWACNEGLLGHYNADQVGEALTRVMGLDPLSAHVRASALEAMLQPRLEPAVKLLGACPGRDSAPPAYRRRARWAKAAQLEAELTPLLDLSGLV